MSDRYLYLEAAMQGQRGAIPPAAAELVSGLVAAAHAHAADPGHDGFAAAVLAALSIHPAFARIGRVCLAQQAPGCPLLRVLGAAVREGIDPGALVPGHHCFIADGSSLATLDEGRLRVFTDARAVAASFAAAGQPPQRSIRLVAAMGMRAGLCLPLVRAGARGFLFINATEPGVFDRLDPTLAVPLAFLAQVARARLAPVDPTLVLGPMPARPLDGAAFAAALRAETARRWQAEPGGIATAGPDLLWAPAAGLAAALAGIEAVAAHPARIAVTLHAADAAHLDLVVEHGSLGVPGFGLADRCRTATGRLAAWGIGCDPLEGGHGIRLRIPADARYHSDGAGALCYSI
jgi:hypothetical protein